MVPVLPKTITDCGIFPYHSVEERARSINTIKVFYKAIIMFFNSTSAFLSRSIVEAMHFQTSEFIVIQIGNTTKSTWVTNMNFTMIDTRLTYLYIGPILTTFI
jgi:hypothetical protein